MHRGYTKRWRKRWDKGYHKDHLLWVVMDYFIDFAMYKDKEVYKKGIGKIFLKRGQWHYSTRDLAEHLSTSRQKIRTCIKALETIDFLTIQTTHRYSIATVINYDTYQPAEEEANPPNNPDLTQPQPSLNPLLYNTKKVKKVKKVKDIKKSTRKDAFSVPGQEEINEASIIKLKADIKMMAEKIYQEGIFKKIHAFANKAAKFSKNERAILHTLNRCYIRGRRKPFKDDKEAWAYCQKVIGIENGNYNERDHQKTTS